MMVVTNDERFIADAMLGKLVKWLRVMGIDVLYDPTTTDAQLLHCAEHERRILLTRDRRLAASRRPARRLFVESDYYHEQVRQVVQTFGLGGKGEVFSRCIRCNTLLQTVSRQLVAGKVPPYVYATQMNFKQCAVCNRLYWGGTHRDNMLRQLRAMLSGAPSTAVEKPC
jgi:uncharacterized protein with PIN domain